MSIESFSKEIEYLYKNYGVTSFFWADENPAQFQNKWINLLTSLKDINVRNNSKLHHMLNTRVDHIIRDKSFLPLYKESGIIAIDLGMESALQNRLNLFNKKITIEQNKQALALLRKYNIISIVQVLVGLPEETYETLRETGDLFQDWNPDLMHFYYTTPFPWTSFGQEMKEHIIETDISRWDYRHPIIKPEDMSTDELVKICKKLKLEFNFNPDRIAKMLQIKDYYRRMYLINALIQSLKYRAGNSRLSTYL